MKKEKQKANKSFSVASLYLISVRTGKTGARVKKGFSSQFKCLMKFAINNWRVKGREWDIMAMVRCRFYEHPLSLEGLRDLVKFPFSRCTHCWTRGFFFGSSVNGSSTWAYVDYWRRLVIYDRRPTTNFFCLLKFTFNEHNVGRIKKGFAPCWAWRGMLGIEIPLAQLCAMITWVEREGLLQAFQSQEELSKSTEGEIFLRALKHENVFYG